MESLDEGGVIMSREKELEKIINGVDENKRDLIKPLIEDVLFLESQLTKLKTYPFLRVNKDNPELQKVTPASKQYKELLQQYSNAIKLISSLMGQSTGDEQSELRKYLERFKNG